MYIYNYFYEPFMSKLDTSYRFTLNTSVCIPYPFEISPPKSNLPLLPPPFRQPYKACKK